MWNLYVMGKATLWFAVGGATIPACSLFPVSAKQWNQYYKLAAIIGERSSTKIASGAGLDWAQPASAAILSRAKAEPSARTKSSKSMEETKWNRRPFATCQ